MQSSGFKQDRGHTRRKHLIIGAALCISAVFGCKGKPDAGNADGSKASAGEKYRFAFVTNNSSEFWNIAVKGVHKAEQDLGVKVEVFRPLKGEVAEQQRYIEDILALGFQGMAISPVNAESMSPVLDRVAAKMPVVCHDSDAPKSKRKSYVGTKNVEAGRAAGAAALKALQAANIKQGKVAIFVGRIDMQNAVERRQGVEETLKGSGLEILPVFLDNADRTKAKKNVEDALARYPDLVLTVGLWSYNGPCLAGAIRESARPVKPLIIAFDEEEETLKAIESGTIQATIVQKPFEFGYQSIKLLKDAADGKPVPPDVNPGIETVEKQNLTAFWQQLRELKK
jgi:ribose transport system substrate-binding protein